MKFDKLEFIEEATCPFLVSARKGRKEADLKGAESRAPARPSRPFKKSPARIADSLEQLNLDPVSSENVPIF